MGNIVELAITEKLLLVQIILKNVMNATKPGKNIVTTRIRIRINIMIDF